MKKKAKAILGAVLAGSMLLSACAVAVPSGTASSAPADNTQASEAAAETSGEPVKIVVAYPLNEVPADQDEVIGAINAISEKEIGVVIEALPINFSNYQQQLNLMLTSNEQIDLFSPPAAIFSAFGTQGHLLDMNENDLLATYGQGIVDAIGEKFLPVGQIAGKQYGITTNRDLAKGYGFAFNVEMAERNGIDLDGIKTIEDVGNALAVIKENEPNVTPLVANAGMSFSYRMMDVDQLGDSYGVLMNKGENLEVVNYFATDEYKEMVEIFHDWYEKGYIMEDDVTSGASQYDKMKAGNGFAYIQPTKPGIDTQESANCGTPIKVVEIISPFSTTVDAQTLQWSIAAKTQYPVETMKFMNLMYTNADVMNLLAWGIEGKHYQVLENGQITYPDGVDSSTSGYDLRRGWAFGNQFLTYVWETDSPTLWEDMKAFNDNAATSKAFGFTFDSTDVQTEYASVANVISEYRAALDFGLLDPETAIPEFNQRLSDAGLDKIIEAKQQQLDAWAGNN